MSNVQVWFAFVLKGKRQLQEGNSKFRFVICLVPSRQGVLFLCMQPQKQIRVWRECRAAACRLKDYAQQLACCTHSST